MLFPAINQGKMMKLLKGICFALCIVNALTVYPVLAFSNESSEEIESYDRQLSEFILEILENFRNQMPTGIPDIGVPPVDPLVIEDTAANFSDGIARIDLRMHDINITGLSKFEVRQLRADLERGFVNFSLTLPELTSYGHCFMVGRILNIFPVDSVGPFYIHVTEVIIDGHGLLNVSSGENTKVHLNDLRLKLMFGALDIKFEGLLGGGRWTKVLLKLLTQIGRNLFAHFHEEAMTELNKVLLKLINNELDKGTLKDLLDIIPS